jgi:hypothetical protein
VPAVHAVTRGWRLPQVPPLVARRRRIFFATAGAVLLVVAGSMTMAIAAMVTTPVAAQHGPVSLGATAPTGCTLLVADRTLRLSDGLAMTLTDVAGRDQDAAAPLAHTAAAVAAAWPALAKQSTDVARSLRGYVPMALACTATLPPAARQAMEANGLTPRANTMWEAVKGVFGPLPAGGFAPGGVRTGHMPGSAHYEGRAVDFLYRPITPRSLRHGWVLAQWAEAHATRLQIAHVIFDARIWTPGPWAQRTWQPYTVPDGPATNPTLLHEDHVHIDVQRGG